MTMNIITAIEPVSAMIGELAPRLRGTLVEDLIDEIIRERPSAESRKALVLDLVVAQALKEAPLASRVRTSSKLARCASLLPEASMIMARDAIAVAEAILLAPDMRDDRLIDLCTTDRQDHMRVIARRQVLSGRLADTIARLGECATVATLIRNPGAQLTADGFGEIVSRYGTDPAIRSLVAQRRDCPSEIGARFRLGDVDVLTGDALTAAVADLAQRGDIAVAVDLLVRAIGRDTEAGRMLLEREDEKALGAVCHVAGIDAHVYEALITAWRRAGGRSLSDVHRTPVRFRLMRPGEIDRIVARMPMARAQANRILAPA